MELTKEQLKKIPKLASGKPDLRSKAYRALKAAQSFTPEAAVPAGGVGFRGTYVPMPLDPQQPSHSEYQIGGVHYTKHDIQPWDAMQDWLGVAGFQAYLRGNAIKYLARCEDKGGREDVLKAKHYLEKLLEVTES